MKDSKLNAFIKTPSAQIVAVQAWLSPVKVSKSFKITSPLNLRVKPCAATQPPVSPEKLGLWWGVDQPGVESRTTESLVKNSEGSRKVLESIGNH